MGPLATVLLTTATQAVTSWATSGGPSTFRSVAKALFRHPLKVVAVFVMAPVLAFRVAQTAENRWRRRLAGGGLVIAVLLAILAGTSLGAVAAFVIGSKFSFVTGLAWAFATVIGSSLSIVVSVALSLLVLNATAWFFLQLSSEDVIEYLRSVTK